jgi:hypothetical protein
VRIAPVVDAATGTVKVTIALPPALVGGDTGFLPGMYAEVTLTTETRPGATLVPKPALVYDEEQPYLFVLEGDRVERVKVELGLSDRDHAEVVSGVDVGQEIVLAGHAGLKDGGLVTRVDESGEPVDGPVEAKPAAPAEAAVPGDVGAGAGETKAAATSTAAAPAVAEPAAQAKPKLKPKKNASRPLDSSRKPRSSKSRTKHAQRSADPSASEGP